MKYEGYSINEIKEHSLNQQGHPESKITVTSYNVSIGDKIVAAGLPNKTAAKVAIDTRRKLRTRAGLDPVG